MFHFTASDSTPGVTDTIVGWPGVASSTCATGNDAFTLAALFAGLLVVRSLLPEWPAAFTFTASVRAASKSVLSYASVSVAVVLPAPPPDTLEIDTPVGAVSSNRSAPPAT